VTIEFDSNVQRLESLEAAAYRLIGMATCQIERHGERFFCQLTPVTLPNATRRKPIVAESLRTHFADMVTDENLRVRLSLKTEGVRNVILALAFGSLAAAQE
jgi:hypothetical protein